MGYLTCLGIGGEKGHWPYFLTCRASRPCGAFNGTFGARSSSRAISRQLPRGQLNSTLTSPAEARRLPADPLTSSGATSASTVVSSSGRPLQTVHVSVFGRSEKIRNRYCNNDYAGDRDRMRYTTGYVFTLGIGAVSWRSTLQSIVALSTVKEAKYLRALLRDLDVLQGMTVVWSNSQSVIHLAKNVAFSLRTKHIEVCDSFLDVENKEVDLVKISTERNPVDCFTKLVSSIKL